MSHFLMEAAFFHTVVDTCFATVGQPESHGISGCWGHACYSDLAREPLVRNGIAHLQIKLAALWLKRITMKTELYQLPRKQQ